MKFSKAHAILSSEFVTGKVKCVVNSFVKVDITIYLGKRSAICLRGKNKVNEKAIFFFFICRYLLRMSRQLNPWVLNDTRVPEKSLNPIAIMSTDSLTLILMRTPRLCLSNGIY